MSNGFDLIAPSFDERRGPAGDDEIAALHDLLRGQATVLDVGGGTGRYADPLRFRGHRFVVADRSRGMILQARPKGLERSVQADASRLPFRDASFDAVLFVEMLHLVPNWVGAVHEMGRVARATVVAQIRERVPDHRKIALETRAAMGKPTGNLDEGARALYRMLRPETLRLVRRSRDKRDFATLIRGLETTAADNNEPRFPEITKAAIDRVIREFGSTEVEVEETILVARWDASAFRGFSPPPGS